MKTLVKEVKYIFVIKFSFKALSRIPGTHECFILEAAYLLVTNNATKKVNCIRKSTFFYIIKFIVLKP